LETTQAIPSYKTLVPDCEGWEKIWPSQASAESRVSHDKADGILQARYLSSGWRVNRPVSFPSVLPPASSCFPPKGICSRLQAGMETALKPTNFVGLPVAGCAVFRAFSEPCGRIGFSPQLQSKCDPPYQHVCGVPPDSSDGWRDGGLGIVLKWVGREIYAGVLGGLKLAV